MTSASPRATHRMCTQVIDDELHQLLADAFLRAPALSTYRCLLAA
jgi:hypothetical protein